MTPEELAQIKARAEAATPGPWSNYRVGFADGVNIRKHSVTVDLPTGLTGSIVQYTANISDADFIAHARVDVPALVAEVERLRADNEHLETVGESLDDVKAEAERRRNELTIMLTERLMPLEQENARLRVALEEYAKKENWGRSRGGYVDRFMPVEDNDIFGWTVAEKALKGGEG